MKLGVPIATGSLAPMRAFTSWKIKRKPKRQTHVTCDLEETAVLAAEPDWHDRSLGALDQLVKRRAASGPSTAGF